MMKQFVDLYYRLVESESVTPKLKCIINYLRNNSERDAEIAIWYLNGNKPRQVISTPTLKKWILASNRIPEWLYDESYDVVKDAEETLSLIVEPGDQTSGLTLNDWLADHIDPMKSMNIEDQQEFFLNRFSSFCQKERLIFLKIISGKLKMCADKKTVIKALSTYSRLDEEIITYRLSKYTFPEHGYYRKLFEVNDLDIAGCRPYPFMPANQYPENLSEELDPKNWIAEWKWKGTRVQLVKRNSKIYIWSKSHEFLTDKFPDLVDDLLPLPDNVVLDGQLVSESDPEAVLRRLNSKISETLIIKYPIKFIAFDILECESVDLRGQALCERKKQLLRIFDSHSFNCIQAADTISFMSYEELCRQRSQMNSRIAEGLIIKDSYSAYLAESSGWYTIKKERSKIKAALLYIQREYQNYEPGVNSIKIMTFGVSEGEGLVSVAKTDCNLSQEDIFELEQYIKENTIERVGPIRVLKPGLIFELSFDDIHYSKRHKSGINIISPMISCWKKDLGIQDIHSLNDLRNFIPGS